MTKIEEAIKAILPNSCVFKPSREFYDYTGIGRKRFWAIYRGSESPTIKEVQKIADYFEIDYKDLV